MDVMDREPGIRIGSEFNGLLDPDPGKKHEQIAAFGALA